MQSGTELWRRFAFALLLLMVGLLSQPVSAQITNGANAVNSNHIAYNAVGFAQIPDNAVGSAQIATNCMVRVPIGTNCEENMVVTAPVGASHIPDNAVNTAQLANNSITLFENKYVGGPEGANRGFYFTSGFAERSGFVPASSAFNVDGCLQYLTVSPTNPVVALWQHDQCTLHWHWSL